MWQKIFFQKLADSEITQGNPLTWVGNIHYCAYRRCPVGHSDSVFSADPRRWGPNLLRVPGRLCFLSERYLLPEELRGGGSSPPIRTAGCARLSIPCKQRELLFLSNRETATRNRPRLRFGADLLPPSLPRAPTCQSLSGRSDFHTNKI